MISDVHMKNAARNQMVPAWVER